MGELLLKLFVGLLPVLLFLLFLIYLDSYKLVRLRTVVLTIVAGGLAAGISYFLNRDLIAQAGLGPQVYSRYVAPVIEEALKAIVVVYLLRAHRIGFLVDAAILGFAVGTGFAWIENLYYLNLFPESHVAVWTIRGFGTAIMHGGTTAIFGVISRLLEERRGTIGPATLLPGLLFAVIVHSFFNHFFLTPVFSSLLILVILPPLLVLVFHRSEKLLQDWLGTGFDADVQLLELIHSGEFSESKPGRYLQDLQGRFPGEVVADMLCYLRLYVELALRAKGELMMRESGLRSELEPEVKAKFEELGYLERSIGKTGRLALMPFLHASRRDLWQLYLLGRG